MVPARFVAYVKAGERATNTRIQRCYISRACHSPAYSYSPSTFLIRLHYSSPYWLPSMNNGNGPYNPYGQYALYRRGNVDYEDDGIYYCYNQDAMPPPIPYSSSTSQTAMGYEPDVLKSLPALRGMSGFGFGSGELIRSAPSSASLGERCRLMVRSDNLGSSSDNIRPPHSYLTLQHVNMSNDAAAYDNADTPVPDYSAVSSPAESPGSSAFGIAGSEDRRSSTSRRK
jgi:hypothetical protein